MWREALLSIAFVIFLGGVAWLLVGCTTTTRDACTVVATRCTDVRMHSGEAAIRAAQLPPPKQSD